MIRKEKEQYIFGTLFIFANQLQAIADRSGGEVTLKQWFLLVVIQKMKSNFPTINMIADFMGYTRQNAKKMLELLEKKGFVKIQKSLIDKRALSVSLTEKCMEYFSLSEIDGNKFLDLVFKEIDNNKLDVVYDVFKILFENINQMNNSKEHYL